jgi:hypothetical protein
MAGCYVMIYRGVENCLQRGKGMRKTILSALLLVCGISGCGTFTLGNVRPQAGRTAEQQQLDTLTCKDQASLAVNSAGRQTGDFLLGMTIVGVPVAYEMDKAKQRQVFADCMKARGYVVTLPDGSATTPAVAAIPTPIQAPAGDQLAIDLPTGFALLAISDSMKSQSVRFYALNRTLDIGVLVAPVRHEGITDLMVYAQTKRASQVDRLKDATFTEVSQVDVAGRPAARYSATGMYSNLKITYVTTIVDGTSELVIVNAWTGATNAQRQMSVLESLAGTVSGIQ